MYKVDLIKKTQVYIYRILKLAYCHVEYLVVIIILNIEPSP